MVSNYIPPRRTTSNVRRCNGRSPSCGEFSIMREISFQSSDFITDQKASEDSLSLNSDCTMGVIRTSTPVSHASSFDFTENFHGVSVILPEGDSARLEGPRAQENGESVACVLEVQSSFEDQPASSS